MKFCRLCRCKDLTTANIDHHIVDGDNIGLCIRRRNDFVTIRRSVDAPLSISSPTYSSLSRSMTSSHQLPQHRRRLGRWNDTAVICGLVDANPSRSMERIHTLRSNWIKPDLIDRHFLPLFVSFGERLLAAIRWVKSIMHLRQQLLCIPYRNPLPSLSYTTVDSSHHSTTVPRDNVSEN